MKQSHSPFFESWPSDWNFDRDLVVVVGTACAEDGVHLEQAGQVRVIEFDPMRASGNQSGREEHAAGNGSLPNWPLVSSHAELFIELERLDHPLPKRARVLLGAAQVDFDQADLHELERAVNACLNLLEDCEQRLGRLGERWVTQTLRNLAKAAEFSSIEGLRGAFEGVPCAIISPGPSLDHCASLLSKLNERALLLTCSHALEALRRANVVPDMVMVADPMDLRRHFDGQPVETFGALILAAIAHPALFELPARERFSFSSGTPIERRSLDALDIPIQLSSGGSVACTEFSLARYMGCSPIILVGQDMAFPEGRYYASSSLDGATRVEVAEDGESFVLAFEEPGTDGDGDPRTRRSEPEALLEVPAQGGGVVATSASLMRFLQWFRLQVSSQSALDEWVNCTVGGAVIEGMRHAELDSVLGSLSSELPNVSGVLAKCARRGLDSKRGPLALAMLNACVDATETLQVELKRIASRGGAPRLSTEEREGLLAQFEQLLPLQWMDWSHASALKAALETGASIQEIEPMLKRARELCVELARCAHESTPS